MTLAENAALAGGAVVASEALGLTDFTPIGGGDGDGDGGSQLPGGAPGLDLGAVADLIAAMQAARDTAGQVPSASQIQQWIDEQIPDFPGGTVPSEGSLPDWLTPDGAGPGEGGGDGEGGPAWFPEGADEPDLRRDPGAFGLGATILDEIGDWGSGAVQENPYATAGTAIGAISPDPVTTAGGFLGGSVVEIVADTVTGGTPLGVSSPIDLTGGGPWWQGPDPLNLGPGAGGGDGSNGGGQNEVDQTVRDLLGGGDNSSSRSPQDRLRDRASGGDSNPFSPREDSGTSPQDRLRDRASSGDSNPFNPRHD